MNNKTALVTGIAGQDGSYLAELLLEKGYNVIGTIRRNSFANANDRIKHIIPKLNLEYADITDLSSIIHVMKKYEPCEIYHLAALSDVRISYDQPVYTTLANCVGTLNVLEAMRTILPDAKMYNAGSCLPAGTKILTKGEITRIRYGKEEKFKKEKSISIENLKIGDEVLSYNLQNGKKEYKKILSTWNRQTNHLYTIRFSNGNMLQLTDNHPIYVHNKGWVRTDQLLIGDKVVQKIYSGLSGIEMKGKNNNEIYGIEKAKKIREKAMQIHKQNYLDGGNIHPWKGKKLDDILDLVKREEIKKRSSESHKGITSWNAGLTAETNEIIALIAKKNSIHQKRIWSDPEYFKSQMLKFRKKFNKSEQKFFNLLEEICPGEFIYNGDGKHLILKNKLPDFVHIKGKKKIIEYNGDYWHKNDVIGEREKIFKNEGYDTLIIWESEFKSNVEKIKQKILDFIYNEKTKVIEIVSIEKNNIDTIVYDIEVEDNHNFFAKGILVHNSEQFGNNIDSDGFQRETTAMIPVSPYGASKVYAHNICQNYKHSYNLFVSCARLFNYESPRRGINFVTNKVVTQAVKIKKGQESELSLGNLNASRDWGHAFDYVNAMWLMLQHDQPDDFVCATGVSHTVKELVEYVFGRLNLEWQKYVKLDQKFLRPEELHFLKGDSSKIRKTLNWSTTYTFETMLDEMIDHQLITL